MEKIINKLTENQAKLVKLILSDSKTETKKIIVRPYSSKNGLKYQIERYIGAQVFHENVDFSDVLQLEFKNYKQITCEFAGETVIFSKQGEKYKSKTKPNSCVLSIAEHNKKKEYLINEGDNIPVMVDLGVFTKDFKLVKSMYDKFKQINKFIELIDHAFKNTNKEEITILDFGCGKSYLTFLVYYYFVEIKKIKAKIIGYDIKKDVVEKCNKIASKYGYKGIEFILANVETDKLFNGKIDMIITLHACNTATDFALNFAINNNVKYVFSVPCCQHEINESIKSGGDYDLFLKDGLFKERFSSLLTDVIRVEVLRSKGYSVDVIEFVDFEHSPKNLMIRAVLNSTKKSISKLKEIQNRYNFNQKLLDLQNKN